MADRSASRFAPTRVRVVALVGVAVIGLGAAGWYAWQHGEPRATTPAVAARPAPAVRPGPVPAEGACAAALAPVRRLMATTSSGSVLSDAGNRALTAGLTRVDRACDGATAAAFRSVELTPWLTYLPPGAVPAGR